MKITKAKFKEVVAFSEQMDLLNIPMNDDNLVYDEGSAAEKFATLRRYVNARTAELREQLLK